MLQLRKVNLEQQYKSLEFSTVFQRMMVNSVVKIFFFSFFGLKGIVVLLLYQQETICRGGHGTNTYHFWCICNLTCLIQIFKISTCYLSYLVQVFAISSTRWYFCYKYLFRLYTHKNIKIEVKILQFRVIVSKSSLKINY